MSRIIVYTDGASRGNPGKGGWAAVVASETKVHEFGAHQEKSTNNQMELKAAYEALKYVDEYFDPKEIFFRTDSKFVIQGASQWVHGWNKNGWMTSKGEPVLYPEIWKPFYDLLKKYGKYIKWELMSGHVAIPGNARADEIATAYADKKKIKLYSDSRNDYPVDLESVEVDKELQQKKSQMRARSKASAYSYISALNGEIQIHKTWNECFARTKGTNARYKKAISKEEEAEIIKEFGG